MQTFYCSLKLSLSSILIRDLSQESLKSLDTSLIACCPVVSIYTLLDLWLKILKLVLKSCDAHLVERNALLEARNKLCCIVLECCKLFLSYVSSCNLSAEVLNLLLKSCLLVSHILLESLKVLLKGIDKSIYSVDNVLKFYTLTGSRIGNNEVTTICRARLNVKHSKNLVDLGSVVADCSLCIFDVLLCLCEVTLYCSKTLKNVGHLILKLLYALLKSSDIVSVSFDSIVKLLLSICNLLLKLSKLLLALFLASLKSCCVRCVKGIKSLLKSLYLLLQFSSQIFLSLSNHVLVSVLTRTECTCTCHCHSKSK